MDNLHLFQEPGQPGKPVIDMFIPSIQLFEYWFQMHKKNI